MFNKNADVSSGSADNSQNTVSNPADIVNQSIVDQASASGQNLSPTVANAGALHLLNGDGTTVNVGASDAINSILAGVVNTLANGLVGTSNLLMMLGDVTGDATPFPPVQLMTPKSQYFAYQGSASAQGVMLVTGATGLGSGVAGLVTDGGLVSGVSALGADGANSANINEMAAEANSINEKIVQNGQLVGDQPYVAPTNTTGGFQTHGITVDQVPMSIQNQLESDLQAGGASDPTTSMQQIVQSGSTVPVPIQATSNTTLYKLVSTTSDYSTPSPTTAFWIDQAQLNLIQAHPELVNDILGLPANSQAASFNVFEIQPKPNTTPTIYQSQVATTTEMSGSTSVGNATQTIVPNRSLWTTPQPTDITIKVN
ncbi:hypothetical protein [Glaciimonas soli]|uniref:Uncharacterized protein n=1 Tax=Glaciimonas soli TaxID=2590999 RepID=A0A843YXS1_9BURK|nr:hypothetical protein [Glaciimonas soli]MQR02061.1 hypothetical protein [Glaciimonas soli]